MCLRPSDRVCSFTIHTLTCWNGMEKRSNMFFQVVHFALHHNQTGLRGFYDIHFAIHFTADVLFLLRDETVCNSAQGGRFVDVHATCVRNTLGDYIMRRERDNNSFVNSLQTTDMAYRLWRRRESGRRRWPHLTPPSAPTMHGNNTLHSDDIVFDVILSNLIQFYFIHSILF